MNKRSAIRCLFVFLCLQLTSAWSSAWAFEAPAGADPNRNEQDLALQRVREELADLKWRWYGIARVRWSYPQKVSAGFGAIFVQQPRSEDCSITCELYGWQFEVEPGLYGIQGSAGWGKLVGETGSMKHLIHSANFGWALRGVVMRTWGDSPLAPQSQTLAGIEGSLSIVRFNFSLGLLRSLSSDPVDGWIISAGLGLGY